MSVRSRPTSLPVEKVADLIIIGASCAGVALAHALACSQYRVALIEPRTYPGYEITTTLRPWMKVPTRLPMILRSWLEEASMVVNADEMIFHPDLLKRGLEQKLLEAGVELYYASFPCGLVFANEQLCGVVIGNKSGRQVILGKAVVDASEWGTLARLSRQPLLRCPSSSFIEARRTLEFTNVAPSLSGELEIPSELEVLHNRVTVHPAYPGQGHVFLECAYQLEFTDCDLPSRMALETHVRTSSMDVAAYLLDQHPAFSQASLAQGSPELWLPAPWRLEAAGAAHASIMVEGTSGACSLPTAAFISSIHNNLFILSTVAALAEDQQRKLLLEPLAAIQLGEGLASLVERAIQVVQLPDVADCQVQCAQAASEHTASSLDIYEPREPQRGRVYQRVAEAAEELPLLTEVDILVVGGGTSGVPAAVEAATSGMKTALLEMNTGLGGTGTLGGVNSYWYGRRVGFTAQLDAHYLAEAARFGEREDAARWNIEVRMQALLRWAIRSGIEIFFRTLVVGALRQGNKVCGVIVATPDGLYAVRARVIIDASGDGDVAAFAGAHFSYGSARDRLPLWYSLAQFVQPGLTRNNFTSAVDISNVHDYTRAILAGRRRDSAYDHGVYIAPRETRHILGEITHTLTDQLTLRRFCDVINICFSNYDVKGKSAADWVLWGLLPPNVESEIAYRAVLPSGLDGILVAGKAFSCTHDALSATRMQADLQNLGGACAVAAVVALQQGVALRDVNIRQVQQRLIAYGVLPDAILTRSISTEEPSTKELADLVASLSGDEPFYIDMDFADVQREPMLLVRVCTAGARIIPLLEEAYSASQGKRQLLLARILAWYGSQVGVACLLEAVEEQLASGQLPARMKKIRHAGYPPDQGAMPELCYLLYTLGMTRDERTIPVLARIVSLLEPSPEHFRDRIKGTFYYVDAICYVAERLGSPLAIPALLSLHRKDGLHGLSTTTFQTDFFEERIAYLEVVIGRALARCASPEGVDILISYLDDARTLLAEHAHDELIAISGEDLGKDKAAWATWLKRHVHTLQPRPWLARID
ncbi:FAD-dependent oxidoreductase [Ktedonosporobacter rubrisoli]|uniref:FAD-dependent oxidoreductase n=1 Tax=Ktedonosporobacter rubrisoli TaxID=2509675 RepID=A0A4P6K4G3_KTERU|nr:FAD-dependent oxidoreductase [Ktedonosporobacter rubrisoli]QBD82852.1 FAD-dependent oxidoreductase [Ktedonosporobacter rubrisoli]